MFWVSKKISKKYAIDVSCFHLIRNFKDGISFCQFSVNLDLYEADHNPQFKILLIILNFKLFEFEIYNINHVSTYSCDTNDDTQAIDINHRA